ncbi:MAG: PAS domain-containing sensor histidine kinase [Bacteroidetes bacterium]|nr:PAS domain-containing sensor histidine kinase [Bacteroidota bacterium]
MDSSKDNDCLQLKHVHEFLVKVSEGNYDAKLLLDNKEDEQLTKVYKDINLLVAILKATTDNNISINSIYNGINDILIVLDDKVEIQKTNHIVESLLLYTESELLNRSIGKLIQKSDFDLVRDTIRNTYFEKKLHETAFNFVTKENNLIPVSCSFSPLFDAHGKSTGILLVAKNISTLIKAEKQRQEKDEELNLFVYKASHDLKSPVSSMISLMDLVNESNDIDQVKAYCKMIADCTLRLDTIIEDLLVLGRITNKELEYEPVNIKDVIDDILKSIEFIDGFKDIKFNIVIDEDTQSIITEKGLFNTILFNLIDNAIKYRKVGSDKSFIKIHVSNKCNGISFKIEDNGIGIAGMQQSNIFKMFYRATSSPKGSGLGLYIVKTSVTKLGGTISVESEFDKGTTFSLYLPL